MPHMPIVPFLDFVFVARERDLRKTVSVFFGEAVRPHQTLL
jgi:hypothetical protein